MPRSNRKILTELLNISGVKVVNYTEIHPGELMITIEAEKNEAICPRCNQKSRRLHQNHTYLIKDLPWGEKKVFLQINRRQFKCDRCGKPFSEKLSYVESRRKYTKRFGEQVVLEVLNGDILNVATRYNLKESEVQQMLSDVGNLKIEPPSTELRKLGIDEIALVKGQGNYVAVFVDISNSKLLEIVPGRRQEDLREVLLSWDREVLNGIEEVSIDLWKPYKSLVQELMPNAEVIADRFHVFKQVNDELDNRRKKCSIEAKKIKKKSQREARLSVLNKSKYVLLKNEKDLKEEQKIKLKEIQEKIPELGKMHRLKEQLRDIYERSEKSVNSTLLLIDWLLEAKEYFSESVKTIIRWFGEVVGYFESGTTQGTVEGINNRLKLIKRKGYGFRNLDNFRLRSLLCWCF